MDAASIFAFVLALVVAGNVALAWIIYGLKQETRATASSLSTIASAFAKWRDRLTEQSAKLSSKLAEVEAQSPLELGVKVVELSEAVERLRKTHQKFAGRVSQELGADPRPDNNPPTLDRDALRREHASAMIPAGLKR
jgi:hypothetical protein